MAPKPQLERAARTSRLVALALGANCRNRSATSIDRSEGQIENLRRCVLELRTRGFELLAVSSLYDTAPVTRTRQSRYLNAVLIADCWLPPRMLLKQLKAIERAAGRRGRGPDRERPLDLDIIFHGGRVIGWPPPRRRLPLVIPHPEAHRRAFVLVPLAEIAPHLVHPALKLSVHRLRAACRPAPGAVRRVLDSSWVSWQ